MLWSMALHTPAMTYLGFQKAEVLQRYPSWAHSCWGKDGRQLTTSVRPLCVPHLNSYFLSALAGDKKSGTSQTQRSRFGFITLWSRVFFSHVKPTGRKQGLHFVLSLDLSLQQVVQFCPGFSHPWTMWTNHSHDSTEIQTLMHAWEAGGKQVKLEVPLHGNIHVFAEGIFLCKGDWHFLQADVLSCSYQ